MNNTKTQYKKKRFWMFPFFLGMIFLLVGVVQWLWNAVLPEIAGVKPVTYWQAFGILVLSKLLFGGFGFGRKKHFYKNHWKDRVSNLSEEEKIKLREEWKKRFHERR